MSVVQYAYLSGKRILLTGDTGRDGLNEAADFAEERGLTLPGIDTFQVPHHGGRHNVSTEVLDRWLGPRIPQKLADGERRRFNAYISASKEDVDHPKKAVVRAIHHRGGRPCSTEDGSFRHHGGSPPTREGWTGKLQPLAYPNSQEA